MNTHAATPQDNATDPVAVADSSRELLTLARRVAASDCTVLVAGESGTGKEVLGASSIVTPSARTGRSSR